MAEILSPEEVTLTEKSIRRVVTIEGGGEEEEATVLDYAPVKTSSGELHHLCLIRGGRTMETDRIVETYGDRQGSVSDHLTDDELLAMGYYIRLFELLEVDEGAVHDRMSAEVFELYHEYTSWEENLSVTDRQLRLLDQAEADSQFDPIYDDVLEEGDWRTVSHDRDLRGFAKGLQRRFDFDAKSCYRNGRIVLEDDRYWENDNVEYVEGIGLSTYAARITGHAWLEHNERVVELTWPWHTPLPPENTVYFGRPVSRSELRDAWNRHERGPYLINTDAIETGR